MPADDPQPSAKAFEIIECSIPAALTIAEWRQRRAPARPNHFYRLRSFLRTLNS